MDLCFCIKISEFCVCALDSIIVSTPVGGPVCFSSNFACVEDIPTEEYFTPYLTVFTTLCGPSEFSVLCPIALLILRRPFLSILGRS